MRYWACSTALAAFVIGGLVQPAQAQEGPPPETRPPAQSRVTPRPITPSPTADATTRAATVASARATADRAIATKGAESVEAADALEELAQALFRAGQGEEGPALMRRVLAIRERTGPPAAIVMALNRLALIIDDDPREVERLARRAIPLAEPLRQQNPALLAIAYTNLGQSLNDQRRFAEADTAYRRSLEIARAAVGDDSPSVATRYLQLAGNLQDMGRLTEAETLFRHNLQILVTANGPDHPDTAVGYDLLAQNLFRQDKFAEAEPIARQAIATRERALGANNAATLNALETLCNILLKQHKTADAEAIARRLVDQRTEASGAALVDLVADQGRMGQILAMQRRVAEAVPYYRRAVALARAKLGDGDPLLANGLISLSGALVNLDPRDAEPVALTREAVALVRSDRARAVTGRAAGRDRGRQALTRALGDGSEGGDLARLVGETWMLVTELRMLQFPAERDAMRRESFTVAQDLAQSAAGRAMAQTAAREAAGTGALAQLVRRQQALSAEARRQSETLIAALGQDVTAEARLRSENERLGVELARVDAELRRSFPDYARMIAPAPLTEQEVQRRLRPDEGLLLIVDVKDGIFLYGISRDAAVRIASPAKAEDVSALVARLRCNIDPVTCDAPEAPAGYEREAAYRLYQALVAPAERALGGVKTLYVTTGGSLADVPFAALLTSPPTTQPLADAPWLGDRYALVSLPAVSSLHAGARRGRTASRRMERFIGYGAPVLAPPGDARAGPAAIARAAQSETALADPTVIRSMPSLPGTEVELRAMARALAAPAGMVRLGNAATETAVRSDPRLGKARVVAFATHGLLPGDLDGLVEPGLVFTPPSSASDADDGVLEASEAAALRLSAEWVILSACNTASPAGTNGSDSLSALARAFLYAGADSLLASHWRIADDVTAALTVETLAEAARNPRAGNAAALQAAMRAIRTGRRGDGSAIPGWTADWAHPAAWAPFSLITDGD